MKPTAKKFDIIEVIGGYAQHDMFLIPGRKVWETAEILCKEQVDCRIPVRYESRVVYGRKKATPSAKHPVEQIGYSYWMYIPFDEDYKKEGM